MCDDDMKEDGEGIGVSTMQEKTVCLWFGFEPPTEEQDEDIKWQYAVDEFIYLHLGALSDKTPGDDEDIKLALVKLDKVITENDIKVFAGAPSLMVLCYLYNKWNGNLLYPILIPHYVWDYESSCSVYTEFRVLGLDRVSISKMQLNELLRIANIVKEGCGDSGSEFSLYRSSLEGSKELSHGDRGSIKVKGFVVDYAVLKRMMRHPFEDALEDGNWYRVTILREGVIVCTLSGVEAKEAIQIIKGECKE